MSRFTSNAICALFVITGGALLATAEAQQGDLAKAKASFAKAIGEANTAGNADQAARSAIGLANALTHEKQHAAAAGVLAIAARLCDIQGAITAPTAAALRDSLGWAHLHGARPTPTAALSLIHI